jgi:glycine/D-amino acid oxidase-like deaminating enzyme
MSASSLWASTTPPPPKRAALGGDTDVDVVIVGGGFTGLWTARELLERDPSLRVLVIEAEHCGFGASGRNGGWASALFATSDHALAKHHGRDAAKRLRTTMQESIDGLLQALATDGIDADQVKAGTITLARSRVQLDRARAEVEEMAQLLGHGDALQFLDAEAAQRHCNASHVFGGTFTPHCATVHPLKLVLGLSQAVEARGGQIVEGTSVFELLPGDGTKRPVAVTSHGRVTADVVVRATEAWTSQFKPTKRAILPIYSLMIATAPLGASTWEAIGLEQRPTFTDGRHLIIYGQRTSDGRLAFGGRGAPYHFGSTIRPEFDTAPRIAEALTSTLRELFPVLHDAEITHAWGGPLGVARDWSTSVTFDLQRGMASAGGYVGDGVTTSYLAGCTLADLIVGLETNRTTLPFVGHVSPRWEREPLRWLGVNAGLVAAKVGDRSEAFTKRPSRVATILSRLVE